MTKQGGGNLCLNRETMEQVNLCTALFSRGSSPRPDNVGVLPFALERQVYERSARVLACSCKIVDRSWQAMLARFPDVREGDEVCSAEHMHVLASLGRGVPF